MRPSFKPNTLYLVTDSDLLNKSAISLEDHVEKAIRGGVDVVQLREKEADTGDFVLKAQRLKKVCEQYNVPLIINDRVDIALAIGADGLHIGQDDMKCSDARKLLGPDSFIGVSVNNLDEAKQAVADGADYLGIGAVYDTLTKVLTKPTMGTSGVQQVIQYLSEVDRNVATVAIGGINASNIERIMFASSTQEKSLDGVALVSAIMTSSDPEGTARGLKGLLMATPAFCQPQTIAIRSAQDQERIVEILDRVKSQQPLVQQMTNNVVKNFSANVTIAIGASPAMSEVRDEATDFAVANGAFLLNMGMVSTFETPIFAVQENNRLGKPCVLDPVGAGATAFRRKATKMYLDHCYFDVLKGNESEIRAAAGLSSTQRGVDNVSSGTIEDRCALAKTLAKKLRNIVVITGVEDVISDGTSTAVLRSGHPWLGEITGSGCSLGSTIAAVMAANPSDKFSATISAVLLYGMAAEHAAHKSCVQGPGTFVPAFIDSLWQMCHEKDTMKNALKHNTDRITLM